MTPAGLQIFRAALPNLTLPLKVSQLEDAPHPDAGARAIIKLAAKQWSVRHGDTGIISHDSGGVHEWWGATWATAYHAYPQCDGRHERDTAYDGDVC